MGLRFIVLTPPERILGHAIGSADLQIWSPNLVENNSRQR